MQLIFTAAKVTQFHTKQLHFQLASSFYTPSVYSDLDTSGVF